VCCSARAPRHTGRPLPTLYKQAIVRSDGSRHLLTELPDVIAGQVWPLRLHVCCARRFNQEWLGREGEVRPASVELLRRRAARTRAGGGAMSDNGALLIGQDAALSTALARWFNRDAGP